MSNSYTKKQVETFDAVSGYKRSVPYKNGTLRLHRVGVYSHVEYFHLDTFGHIVETFLTEEEANKFIDDATK